MMSREKKMQAKKKKSHIKLTSTGNEATKKKLWPDLPQQLINLIARNSSMMKDLYSKGVTKSWRTQSRKCGSNYLTPPWLQLSANFGSDDIQPHTFNIPFKMGYTWYWSRQSHKPTFSGYHFLGCSQGLLLAKGASGYTLWKPYPYSGICWSIPSWDTKIPFLFSDLSSFPLIDNQRKSKSIVMVLTGISHPAFVYYRIWEGLEKGWIPSDSTIVDPHCSNPSQRDHLIRFSNGIWFEEKFYALSLQGTLVVIEDIDSNLRITSIGKRVVPSVTSMHYRECMIESGGKILIVLLISRNSVNKADYVEVYELNTDDLTWIKKQKLGDLAVFLGVHCCMGVSAKRAGCRRNCIYFNIFSGNGWWIYDMETDIISPTKFLDWVGPSKTELENENMFKRVRKTDSDSIVTTIMWGNGLDTQEYRLEFNWRCQTCQ